MAAQLQQGAGLTHPTQEPGSSSATSSLPTTAPGSWEAETPGGSFGPTLCSHKGTKTSLPEAGTRSAAYQGTDDGVRVVQADVVVDEDVVNAGIMGVDPQGLPAPRGELIPGPPGTARGAASRQGGRGRQEGGH